MTGPACALCHGTRSLTVPCPECDKSASDRITLSPHDRALMDFDGEHGGEPTRTIAERIAAQYGIDRVHMIVDDIAHAIEDARDRGEKRGKFLARN